MVKADIVEIPLSDHDVVANYIASKILKHLSGGEQVAWFVSGGSNIVLAKKIRRSLDLKAFKGKLHIFLVDERFGPVGHNDSNWEQLLDVGFDTRDCKVYPIIKNNYSTTDTAIEYNNIIKNMFSQGYYTIGQLGLGPDGHTSGLLPNNPLMNSADYYGYYLGPDYQRITSTPKLLEMLDEIVLFASGQSKSQALRNMLDEGPVDDIPARLLKNSKNLKIFTDIKLKETK